VLKNNNMEKYIILSGTRISTEQYNQKVKELINSLNGMPLSSSLEVLEAVKEHLKSVSVVDISLLIEHEMLT